MLNQKRILRVFRLIAYLRSGPSRSIRNLARLLEVNERSVYRYLDLLREIGFDIEQDNYKRFSILAGPGNDYVKFSKEESHLLVEIICTAAKNNKLKDSLLKKVSLNSDAVALADSIINVHIGNLVSQIGEAISEKRQIVLKKYQSASSKRIDDRLVEPISITTNYTSLVAFEPSSGKNKIFSLDRISEIKLTKTKFKFALLHQVEKTDIFGFGNTGKAIDVDIKMNLRAYVIMKHDYPLSDVFIKKESDNISYRLRTTVNDLKPVVRFVIGLFEDVEVVGSDELLKQLRLTFQTYVKRLK